MSEEKWKGYKAFEPGLICKGKQYAENTVFEEAGGEICGAGMMHYCENPFDVLNYYPLVDEYGKVPDFAEVEALEKPITDGDKSATKKIKIGVKLGLDGFVNACVDFLYEKTIKDMPDPSTSSGDDVQIGSAGDDVKIGSDGFAVQIGSAGDYVQIGSTGRYVKIGSAGRHAKIVSTGLAAKIGSAGRYAQIGSTGDDAVVSAEADNAVVAVVGRCGKVKGKIGTWITLAEYGGWDGEGYPCLCVKSAKIDGEILKPDIFYTLKNGEFTETT